MSSMCRADATPMQGTRVRTSGLLIVAGYAVSDRSLRQTGRVTRDWIADARNHGAPLIMPEMTVRGPLSGRPAVSPVRRR